MAKSKGLRTNEEARKNEKKRLVCQRLRRVENQARSVESPSCPCVTLCVQQHAVHIPCISHSTRAHLFSTRCVFFPSVPISILLAKFPPPPRQQAHRKRPLTPNTHTHALTHTNIHTQHTNTHAYTHTCTHTYTDALTYMHICTEPALGVSSRNHILCIMMLRQMPLLAKRGRPPSALSVLHPSRSPATITTQHHLPGSISSASPSVPLLLRCQSTTAPTTSIPDVTSTTTTTSQQPSLASSRSASVVDFSNTEVAYATLSTMDLIRAYLVFKACAIKPLVTHADQILQFSYRILGKSLIEGIVRRTFFRHFCAGETSQMIRPRIAKLKEAGVAGILDYAAEADIKEMMTSPAVEATTQAYKEGEIACRVYEYENERTCDAHVQTFLECIHAVKDVTPEGFAAIKVTALGNPQLLERMSVCVVEMGKLFKKFDTQDKGYITRQEFLEGYDRYFLPSSSPSSSSGAAAPVAGDGKDGDLAAQLLARLDPNGTDRIDIIHWRIALALTDLSALTRLCRGAGPLKAAVLSEEETELMQGLQLRLETLARRASSLGVRLMIDAEQSYFQPAIDHLVLDLMQRHNKGKFVVYTTVQCYLKGAQRRIVREMQRAQRQDYFFAAKLVRGAYMITERKRAEELVRAVEGREGKEGDEGGKLGTS